MTTDAHVPYVRDDQDSPYWSIRCSCGWRSGACTQLEAVVEAYGDHRGNNAIREVDKKGTASR